MTTTSNIGRAICPMSRLVGSQRMGINMKLQVILVIGFFVCTALVRAEEKEIGSKRLEGVMDGIIERSDGTRLTAKYTVSYDDDDVVSLLVEDEDNNAYLFESIVVEEEKISFLWNPEKEGSQCELLLSENGNSLEGECMVFQDQSIKFIMLVSESYPEKNNEQ